MIVFFNGRVVIRYPEYAAGYWMGCYIKDGKYIHKMVLDGVAVEIPFTKIEAKRVPALEVGSHILFSLELRGTRYVPLIEKVNNGTNNQ